MLKMEENMQHFWHIMLYYFKKGKNTTEMQKEICAVYGESTVTERVKSGLRIFVLEISHWIMLHHWVDQMKLIAIKSKHLLRTMNIISLRIWLTFSKYQINKAIGENEKCVFYFMEKNIWNFWPTQCYC